MTSVSKVKFLILLLLLSVTCRAEFVPADRAAIVASNFLHSNDITSNFVSKRMSLYDHDESNITKANDKAPAHYIFQGEDGKGFVIVAADDACQPILGYSYDGTLSVDGLPDNMKYWLEWVDDQINYARDNNLEPSKEVKKQWAFTKAGNGGKVLETAKWDQGSPYNEKCPMDGDNHSLTGCVATATAIVMRYHKWPQEGKGKTDSYYTKTRNLHVPAMELDHSYNWDRMPLNYSESNKSLFRQVAVLMAEIGAAFKADYTASSTSASYDLNVLYRNFGYSPSMRSISRSNYNNSDWTSMLKRQIDANLPVLYRGEGKNNEGHAFVIDGYQSDYFFHINWGWGGESNGNFSLGSLVPNSTWTFTDDQWAIVDMRPASQTDKIKLSFKDSGIWSYTQKFRKGVSFGLGVSIGNDNMVNFSGDIMLAVTDRNGKIKQVLKEYPNSGSWGLYTYERSLTINEEIKVGDRIRAFYREDEETEWSLITSDSYDIPWEILIAEEYYLHEITSFSYNNDLKEIELITKEYAVVRLYDPEDTEVTELVDRDDTYACIHTDKLVEGQYKIVISTESDSMELLFSIIY